VLNLAAEDDIVLDSEIIDRRFNQAQRRPVRGVFNKLNSFGTRPTHGVAITVEVAGHEVSAVRTWLAALAPRRKIRFDHEDHTSSRSDDSERITTGQNTQRYRKRDAAFPSARRSICNDGFDL